VANENRAKALAEDGFKMDKFACVSCGYFNNADENDSSRNRDEGPVDQNPAQIIGTAVDRPTRRA
jgi:hypothetical protein